MNIKILNMRRQGASIRILSVQAQDTRQEFDGRTSAVGTRRAMLASIAVIGRRAPLSRAA
jgi:hypothetical protein